MRLDYVTVQARLKNSLLEGQGHYDLGAPGGGELVLVSTEQASAMRQWWVQQIVSTWEWYSETHGTLPETQQKELQRAQDTLIALELDVSDQATPIEYEAGVVSRAELPWLEYDSAVAFWQATGKTAILLNAIGVVPSVESVAWESIFEAVKEAPERVGEVMSGAIVAVGKTAGETLYGLIKGFGLTALIIAGVVAGTVIVLRRAS